MVLAGRRGAGMFNHKDTLQTMAYQLQAQGGKRWHLCPPDSDAVLAPLASAFAARGPGRLSLLRPDYAAAPSLLSLDCFADDVLEGEAVFYPREYWHETDNLFDWTVAVTGTMSAAANADHVGRQLRASCRGAEPGPTGPLDFIKPSPDLCRHYERCGAWWEAAHGTATRRWEPAAGQNATARWLLRPASADMRAAAARAGETAARSPTLATRVDSWADGAAIAADAREGAAESCDRGALGRLADTITHRGRSRELGDVRQS